MKRIGGVVALLLAGCMTPPTWHKSGSSQSDFYVDRGQCNAQAYSVPGMQYMQVGIVFNSCMQGKGWQLYRDQ